MERAARFGASERCAATQECVRPGGEVALDPLAWLIGQRVGGQRGIALADARRKREAQKSEAPPPRPIAQRPRALLPKRISTPPHPQHRPTQHTHTQSPPLGVARCIITTHLTFLNPSRLFCSLPSSAFFRLLSPSFPPRPALRKAPPPPPLPRRTGESSRPPRAARAPAAEAWPGGRERARRGKASERAREKARRTLAHRSSPCGASSSSRLKTTRLGPRSTRASFATRALIDASRAPPRAPLLARPHPRAFSIRHQAFRSP
jgi:hypothetical protein